LDGLMPENEAWISTQAAKVLGVADGQRVVLENQDGVTGLPIKLRVTAGIRSDCVYMVHGFGNQSHALRRAYRKGASDADLMTRVKIDPIMGGTGMRVNFVRVLTDLDGQGG
jgi:thiosulfate reductase/polysulfide reductase chain A